MFVGCAIYGMQICRNDNATENLCLFVRESMAFAIIVTIISTVVLFKFLFWFCFKFNGR